MNNCRAGLYSFAPTTSWLLETGMASPPLLVMLGLTLPDSRILSGIASIGLTLANIAVILPYLRQPVLDSLHALKSALAEEHGTQEQIKQCQSTQLVDPPVECSVLASVSYPEREHESPPPTCSSSVKSVCFLDTETPGCPDIECNVVPLSKLLSTTRKTNDDQVPPPAHHCLDADSSEIHIGFSYLFARECRSPLRIPLPVPDEAEVAFFEEVDARSSATDLGEDPVEVYNRFVVPGQHPIAEPHGPTVAEPTSTDAPSTRPSVEPIGNVTRVAMPCVVMVTFPPSAITAKDHNSTTECDTFDFAHALPTGADIVQTAQVRCSLVTREETLAKRRPESLEFIPQSVIRRYPSAPRASADYDFGCRNLSPDYHISSAPLRTLAHNPAMMPVEGTKTTGSCTAQEDHRRASFLIEVHPTRGSMGERAFFTETAPAQSMVQQGRVFPPGPPTGHELPTPRRYPMHGRRLGILPRFTARRRWNGVKNEFFTSDSDSDLDSDSQHSSGSSGYESMLPHMLGTDLIAAINANSESELNLAGPRRAMRMPLNVYEDFLFSEDSAADVSMTMHVSSIDDASGEEVRAPATSRSLTYEDIQEWASGVVQKCVRQVYRNRVPVDLSSPSQASDICAERPSGSGASQCPLSGLHCKLGAASSTRVPVPRTKEAPLSFPVTSTSTSRKPQVRNLHDIPEFVPRQRHASTITRCSEGSGRLITMNIMNATHDAASRVIARMENQAGFRTRQWLVGTGENMVVNMAGGRESTLMCA